MNETPRLHLTGSDITGRNFDVLVGISLPAPWRRWIPFLPIEYNSGKTHGDVGPDVSWRVRWDQPSRAWLGRFGLTSMAGEHSIQTFDVTVPSGWSSAFTPLRLPEWMPTGAQITGTFAVATGTRELGGLL